MMNELHWTVPYCVGVVTFTIMPEHRGQPPDAAFFPMLVLRSQERLALCVNCKPNYAARGIDLIVTNESGGGKGQEIGLLARIDY